MIPYKSTYGHSWIFLQCEAKHLAHFFFLEEPFFTPPIVGRIFCFKSPSNPTLNYSGSSKDSHYSHYI